MRNLGAVCGSAADQSPEKRESHPAHRVAFSFCFYLSCLLVSAASFLGRTSLLDGTVDHVALDGAAVARHVLDATDEPGGIGVEDCAALSRQLSRVFEVEGVDYERLEVSSPGLDRPLRKSADFDRFAGQKAELRMRRPDESGRRKFVGVLRGMEESRVMLELEGQTVRLELGDVERARLVFH